MKSLAVALLGCLVSEAVDIVAHCFDISSNDTFGEVLLSFWMIVSCPPSRDGAVLVGGLFAVDTSVCRIF